jgi:hypothetical protein
MNSNKETSLSGELKKATSCFSNYSQIDLKNKILDQNRPSAFNIAMNSYEFPLSSSKTQLSLNRVHLQKTGL